MPKEKRRLLAALFLSAGSLSGGEVRRASLHPSPVWQVRPQQTKNHVLLLRLLKVARYFTFLN